MSGRICMRRTFNIRFGSGLCVLFEYYIGLWILLKSFPILARSYFEPPSPSTTRPYNPVVHTTFIVPQSKTTKLRLCAFALSPPPLVLLRPSEQPHTNRSTHSLCALKVGRAGCWSWLPFVFRHTFRRKNFPPSTLRTRNTPRKSWWSVCARKIAQ